MIVDIGSAAAPHVRVIVDGRPLGTALTSLNTDTKEVSYYVHAQLYTQPYSAIYCSFDAPDFVRLIPDMKVVEDIDLVEYAFGETTASETLTVPEGYTLSVSMTSSNRMIFSERVTDPSWQDSNSRLCRTMWELFDSGNPVVLECFQRNRIEFLDRGERVFPNDLWKFAD